MFIKVLLIEEKDFDVKRIKSSLDKLGVNKEFDFLHIRNDNNIKKILSSFNPHVVLTFDGFFKNIENLRLKDQDKYLKIPSDTPISSIGDLIMKKFLSLLNENKNMMFSIITPLYKSKNTRLERLYKSLLNQTYNNWEWILFDDSPKDYLDTYNFIDELSNFDNRIFLYKRNKNSGIIGEVKKSAFSLGKGDVLVEVDHDDELVDTCLENLLKGYSYSDEIGFVYGHTCEMFEDGNSIMDYGDDWAYGYGGYRNYKYKNKDYKVAVAPNINSKTIRNIIGIPNHVRSWRKDVYHKIGGHNENIHVADDYELMIRTFLNTKMAKIDTFTYIQYFDQEFSNTQWARNSEIQRLVIYFSNFYNDKIHNRFLELGVDDFTWKDGNINLDLDKQEKESYANVIIKI